MATIFSVYIALGHSVSLSQAFTVILFFGMIRQPVDLLSGFITTFSQVKVSMKRLENYLDTPDINFEKIFKVESSSQEGNQLKSISITKSSFSWKKDEKDEPVDEEEADRLMQPGFCLRDIELEVNRGELVFVVGEIGSGKSALLQTLIG